MDPNNTYIDPRVKIGSGTVILPGTILRGRTVIGKNCTIGPNAMIRDCTVGNGSYIAAGSTITDEVPADSLAIARERQVNKPGWAEQWRAAHEKK